MIPLNSENENKGYLGVLRESQNGPAWKYDINTNLKYDLKSIIWNIQHNVKKLWNMKFKTCSVWHIVGTNIFIKQIKEIFLKR